MFQAMVGEASLAADIVEPTQQELAESHHRFDDPEYRFRGLLAQGIEGPAFRHLQARGGIAQLLSMRAYL
jgi:hypothetical protein